MVQSLMIGEDNPLDPKLILFRKFVPSILFVSFPIISPPPLL